MAEHHLPRDAAETLLFDKPVRDCYLTSKDVQNIKYGTGDFNPTFLILADPSNVWQVPHRCSIVEDGFRSGG